MSIYIRRTLFAFLNALMIASLAAQAQQSSAPAGNPAAAGSPAQADQPPDREQQRQQQQRRLALLVQTLSLTEDQKRQWLQIQKQTNQNVRAARKDDSLNEEQMQQKLKEIHAEQKRQLLALLAPQQQEALKKWWGRAKAEAARKRRTRLCDRRQGRRLLRRHGPGLGSPGASCSGTESEQAGDATAELALGLRRPQQI